MEPALKRLIEIMPPPAEPRQRNVDWQRLEAAVGLTYPTTFKEFIGVYGGSVWFDNLSLCFTEANTDDELKPYLRNVMSRLEALKDGGRDENKQKIVFPLYPADGGLFPFMIDYSGYVYCWLTEDENPNNWPIVCWLMDAIHVLENMTIAMMILEWIERKPRMQNVWGDINDIEQHRFRLS